MNNLPNPPKRHINTTHLLTQFLCDNQQITKSTNTIHKELYKYILQNSNPPTIQALAQIKFLIKYTTCKSPTNKQTTSRIHSSTYNTTKFATIHTK